MKKILLAVLLLCCASGVSAKTLSNGSSLAPATDTVYEAVVAINDEVTRIFGYLNTLYKLQAAASAPTDNATGDVWLDTSTTPPGLKYYDGDSWETLSNPAAYNSTLSFASSNVGYSMGCVLEQDAATKSVMLNASAVHPCTFEAGGELLQIASKITYDFTSTADGRYYVHPVRSGSTSAFVLTGGIDTSKSASVHYLGEVVITGGDGTIKAVASYEGMDQRLGSPLPGFARVSRTAAKNVGTSWAAVEYDTEDYDPFDLMSSGTYTAPYSGWYRVDLRQTIWIVDGEVHYIGLYINNSVSTNEMGANYSWMSHSSLVHLEAGDTVAVRQYVYNTTRVMSVDDTQRNSFTIYFAGGNY